MQADKQTSKTAGRETAELEDFWTWTSNLILAALWPPRGQPTYRASYIGPVTSIYIGAIHRALYIGPYTGPKPYMQGPIYRSPMYRDMGALCIGPYIWPYI